MPGGHIFNKDGTRMIKVRSTPQTPSTETPTSSHDTQSNGLPSEPAAGPNVSGGSKKKKKKNRNKGAATHSDSHFDPPDHASLTHDNHSHFDPSVQGPSKKNSYPQTGPNTSRQHLQEYYDAIRASLEQFDSNEYFEIEGDDAYYSDEEPPFEPTDHGYDGPSSHQAGGLDAPSSKKNKKKKKKKGAGTHAGLGSEGVPSPAHEVTRGHAQKASKDRIWNTSTSEERERIKNFWLSLGEDERRSLVKVEKEAVLKKMKEQQKHSCSCSVCGRKRTAIEEELEVLYDAYYEELEHPSKALAQSQRRIEELPELEEDEEGPYDDDEEYEDISEDGQRSVQQDFFNFGNSLTVREGGILTVADDLLKNDGKKFIEMMEQLAERRMAREEEASHAHGMNNPMHSGIPHTHSHMPPNGNSEYDIEEDDEEYDDEDEDFDEEDEEEQDTMTEEQRMEEGRRMFQIFAARMFEQRVLSAYRERVAIERQNRLLEEEDEEKRREQELKDRKAREKEKKNAKKKAQKEAKEADLKEKAEKKAEEEAKKKAEDERKAEEARRRKEEQRIKREAERKAAEEERLKREEEKKKRLQKERELELERERKRKEQLEVEKKKKAETLRKQKEEKEQRDKEKREKDERDRKDRESRRKAAEEKERERIRKESEAASAPKKLATTPILAPATKVLAASSPRLHPPTIVPAVVSPRLAVAAPALPKQTSPNKAKSSTKGSVASSPQTPKIQVRHHLSTALGPAQPPATTASQTGAPVSTAPGAGSVPSAASIVTQKRTQGQTGSTPLQQTVSPVPTIPQPPNILPGHLPPIANPQGFPSHISPPPGVPPPENFPIPLPNQPFLPPGHRPHGNMSGLLPPPGQMPFAAQNVFRGFPGGHNMNPPMPLGPPPGTLRGFPPPSRGPFMSNDFSALPQPIPGSSFGPPPGSPFIRQENMAPGHQRQSSNEHNELTQGSAPKPIHRPTPIQRPTNTAPGGPVSKINIDELSTSLGSSALLGDDEPEEPGSKGDGVSPSRRGSNIPGGRGVFGFPPGPSPFFLGHDSRTQPFGGFPSPSPSNTWGAPSPLFNPSATWGAPPPPGSGWGQEASTVFGHNQRRQTNLDIIRLLAINVCNQAPASKKSASGFISMKIVQEAINSMTAPPPPHDVSEAELVTICEIEGDMQNGGGWFLQERDEDGTPMIKYEKFYDEARRVSSTGGSVVTPIGGPGEIGSPIVGSAATLPFSVRHNAIGTGIAGSPHF